MRGWRGPGGWISCGRSSPAWSTTRHHLLKVEVHGAMPITTATATWSRAVETRTRCRLCLRVGMGTPGIGLCNAPAARRRADRLVRATPFRLQQGLPTRCMLRAFFPPGGYVRAAEATFCRQAPVCLWL